MRKKHSRFKGELSPYPENFVMSSLLAHAEDLSSLGSYRLNTETKSVEARERSPTAGMSPIPWLSPADELRNKAGSFYRRQMLKPASQ